MPSMPIPISLAANAQVNIDFNEYTDIRDYLPAIGLRFSADQKSEIHVNGDQARKLVLPTAGSIEEIGTLNVWYVVLKNLTANALLGSLTVICPIRRRQ